MSFDNVIDKSNVVAVRDGGYSNELESVKSRVVELHKDHDSVKDLEFNEDSFASILDYYGISYHRDVLLDESTLSDDKSYHYSFEIPDQHTLVYVHNTLAQNSYFSQDNDDDGVPKKYNLHLSEYAQKYGDRCLHVFDWEDYNSVISLFFPTEVVYARKCAVMKIDSKTTNLFEDKNHIQGHCAGQKVCYGLYHKGELVEVMTFGKPRYNRNFKWELMRLCSKIGVTVVGGASKLFKYFVDDENPESIISYCDRAKFNGDVYLKMGMKLHHKTEPNKIWSKGKDYITNNFLLQRGYDQLFNANYGTGTSNEELMLLNGWLPVYDCGQNVYSWDRKDN